MGEHTYATVPIWGSEDNLEESVLSFYFMSTVPPIQVSRLDSKHPYPLAWKCMFETPGSAITLVNWKVLLLLYFSGNSGRGAKQACLKCKIWEARQW